MLGNRRHHTINYHISRNLWHHNCGYSSFEGDEIKVGGDDLCHPSLSIVDSEATGIGDITIYEKLSSAFVHKPYRQFFFIDNDNTTTTGKQSTDIVRELSSVPLDFARNDGESFAKFFGGEGTICYRNQLQYCFLISLMCGSILSRSLPYISAKDCGRSSNA